MMMIIVIIYIGYIAVWKDNQEVIPFISNFVHLEVPHDYVAVINLHFYDVQAVCSHREGVTLRSENKSTDYWFCGDQGNRYTEPVLYPSHVLVEYRKFGTHFFTDFRLLFSFHRTSALPVKLTDGRWNCSGVHWPDMQQHFPCNFQSDCVGGEDEAGCWRGDGTCSHGNFQADGRCFLIARAEHEQTSWNLASDWCQQRGARLSSLSTKKVWDTVLDLFFRIGDGFTIPIGVRLSPPTVPHLYV